MYSAFLVVGVFVVCFWLGFVFFSLSKQSMIWGATRQHVRGNILTAPLGVASHCLLKSVHSLGKERTGSLALWGDKQ